MTQVFLETLSEIGHETFLVDRRFSTSMDQVGKASLAKLWRLFDLVFRLTVALRHTRFDVCVFFVTTRPGSLLVDWIISEILTAFKMPTVAYLHTLGFNRTAAGSKFFNWIIKRLLSNSQQIVTLSARLEYDSRSFAPAAKYLSVPNTVLAEVRGARRRLPPARPHLVYMSNLIPEKGAKDFILLAKRLTQTMDAEFSLIGAVTDPKFEKELRNMAHDLELNHCLSIRGPIYDEAKWTALAEATALVFPSTYRFEAQPLTIIEALHVGTPVLAYRLGAVEDCVIDGETGWTSEPADIESLALNLQKIVASDDEWSAYSSRCQTLYMERFSRAAFERSWREILKSF